MRRRAIRAAGVRRRPLGAPERATRKAKAAQAGMWAGDFL